MNERVIRGSHPAELIVPAGERFESLKLPKTPPIRELTFEPFIIDQLSTKLLQFHSPKQGIIIRPIISAIISFVSFVFFHFHIHEDWTYLIFMLAFIHSFASFFVLLKYHVFVSYGSDSKSNSMAETKGQSKYAMVSSKDFIKPVPSLNLPIDSLLTTPLPTMSLYRPFVVSDRATSALIRSTNIITPDTSVDQLAADTLRRLNIPTMVFTQYLANMKSFIARTLLSKLALKIHSGDPVVELMLSVPTFEHYRSYIIQRIRALAGSHFLAGHFGDKGDRYKDREWSKEMPSDNQIILHLLGAWLSFFMAGKRSGNKIQNTFQIRHVSFAKEPTVDTDDDIVLCSDDMTTFYVLTKHNSATSDRFWAFPGRDSMYAGLTLFFWFVKEKLNFLLDGADLTDVPLTMDRVFSHNRFD